jgi:uncharacterized damage-inducible protein DinB
LLLFLNVQPIVADPAKKCNPKLHKGASRPVRPRSSSLGIGTGRMVTTTDLHTHRMTTDEQLPTERRDFLETLAKHRGFLLEAVRGITDDQARLRPTVSELCLGGIVKHVTQMERQWADFIVEGARESGPPDEAAYAAHAASFCMERDETLAQLLAAYAEVSSRTDTLVTSLPTLDVAHALPPAPWFPPGAQWSARRVLLHIVAETAQHAGHADIIRESIDGAKTMG